MADAELDKIIAEVSALVRQAYAAGQQEAVRRVLAVVSGGAPLPPEPRPSMAAPPGISPPMSTPPAKRAAPGAVKAAVRSMILNRPDGISEAEINDNLSWMNRSSRYMAIRSLVEDGEAVRREGRLFPANKAVEGGAQAPPNANDLLA